MNFLIQWNKLLKKNVKTMAKDIKVKSIVKAYTTRREVSVQEAVYLVLSELWLRLAFLDVIFVNSNIPEKRFYICLSGKIYQKITQ